MSPHTDEGTSPSPAAGALAVTDAAPSLGEIVQLTRHELTTAQDNDSILECGRAALLLLHTNPSLSVDFAYQKLHDVPYKEVKTCWRRLYTDATLWRVLNLAEGRVKQAHTSGYWVDEVVKLLDMALILTAAPNREELVELWFAALEQELSSGGHADGILERPSKRLKFDNAASIPSAFRKSTGETRLPLRYPIPQSDNLSLTLFMKKLSSPATHTPLIVKKAIQHWPALSERPWSDPNYLLKRTIDGRRLVPIETGRSYTDSGWGQKILTFKEFMSTYMLRDSSGKSPHDQLQKGYLAQHDLFAQIPSLRADISIPDFCYCDPAPSALPHITAMHKLEDPLLNAWFGPSGTISPLHTDPYHNILAQVVGYKYVRLYAPDQTKWLYPRSLDESGVDMSNTSLVDLDEAMEAYPDISVGKEGQSDQDLQQAKIERGNLRRQKEFEEQFPGFTTAKYVEGVLGPGECLYLPPGWWHYVKSLSPSFSVSFWFN